MIALDIIKDTIPPLKLSDNGAKALTWMNSFHVHHLPVIDGQQYIGLLAEHDILDENAADKLLGEYDYTLRRPFVHTYVHVYEVIKTLIQNNLSVVPVLDDDDRYVGMITTSNLLDFFATANSLQDPGGIVILEMNVNDYMLSEIARIVEGHNAKILSVQVRTHSGSRRLDVTLKINKTDLQKIRATFERYNYVIKATYQEQEHFDSAQERFDSFLHFLNL